MAPEAFSLGGFQVDQHLLTPGAPAGLEGIYPLDVLGTLGPFAPPSVSLASATLPRSDAFPSAPAGGLSLVVPSPLAAAPAPISPIGGGVVPAVQEVVLTQWAEVPQVVALLRRSQPILLRLEALKPVDQQRAIDFLCGAAVVLRADCRRTGAGAYHFEPQTPWRPAAVPAAPLERQPEVLAA